MSELEQGLRWVRTATGERRHLLLCRHLSDTPADQLITLGTDELDAVPACRWCADEAAGVGRTYFESFERAMEAFQAPVPNRPRMREVAASMPQVFIWTVRSGQYIALAGTDGKMAVAFGKSWIWTPNGGDEYLPNYVGVSGGSSSRSNDRVRVQCPNCWVELPDTGVCDTCGYTIGG